MDEDADVEPTPDGSPADDSRSRDATDRTESTAADSRSQEAGGDARQRPDDDAPDDETDSRRDPDGDESDDDPADDESDGLGASPESGGAGHEGGGAVDADGREDADGTASRAGGPTPGVPAADDGPSHDAPDVPEDVRKYARFKKMDGAQYERVNEFLRDRTYVTAREWAIARLCSDFRTETGVEMTKIGEHLPRLVPFMTDTYTPQAVNQARSAFDDKVRKAGATFLYGAMCDFYTAEELDDVMYEVTEVAKFLLEVEGVDLTVDEELDAEERISSVMREVREASRELRTEDLTTDADDGEDDEPAADTATDGDDDTAEDDEVAEDGETTADEDDSEDDEADSPDEQAADVDGESVGFDDGTDDDGPSLDDE